MSAARRAAGMRFRPPPVAMTPELVWLLARAFGPAGAPVAADGEADAGTRGGAGTAAGPPGAPGGGAPWRGAGPDGMRVADLAEALDLAGRVAARQPQVLLAAELGEEAAARLARRRHAAAAAALLGGRLAEEVAVAATECGVPLILLKGFSLHLSGRVPPGGRSFADLDLLAPEDGARALHAALIGMGFRAAAGPANEQHLPPLAGPRWGALDLHFRLRGVTAGGGWATAEELLAAGRCRREPSLPGDCHHLEPEVAAAHVLAHGLDQHGWRPQTYPLARMLADLLDLAGETGPGGLIASTGELLSEALGADERAAVERLLERLAAGRLPAGDEPADAGAAILLRHVLAGALDRRYAESLRWRHLLHRLGEARRRGALGAYLAGKLAELAAAAPAAPGRGRPFARLTALARGIYQRLAVARRGGLGR